LTACAKEPPQGADITDRVTRVWTGDRIVLGRHHALQLHGVRAPGREEPGGYEALRFTSQFVSGARVSCQLSGARRGGHATATCFADGRDIGAALVAAGLARDCPRESGGDYAQLETERARRSLPLPADCGPK
jgi:endonuclease YncB( thermonuclease family)